MPIRTIEGGMFHVFMWECTSLSENPGGAPNMTLDDGDEDGADECSAVVKLEMMSPISLNFDEDDISCDSVNDHQHQYVDATAITSSPSPVGDGDAGDEHCDSATGSQHHRHDTINSQIDENVDDVSIAIPSPSLANPLVEHSDTTSATTSIENAMSPTPGHHALADQPSNVMSLNSTDKTFGKFTTLCRSS